MKQKYKVIRSWDLDFLNKEISSITNVIHVSQPAMITWIEDSQEEETRTFLYCVTVTYMEEEKF